MLYDTRVLLVIYQTTLVIYYGLSEDLWFSSRPRIDEDVHMIEVCGFFKSTILHKKMSPLCILDT